MNTKSRCIMIILAVICVMKISCYTAFADNCNEEPPSFDISEFINDPSPIEEISNGGTTTVFVYDELGNRISKETSDGTLTEFRYSDSLLYEIRYSGGDFTCVYDEESNNLVGLVYLDKEYKLFYDEDGSVTDIYDLNGLKVCHYDYSDSIIPNETYYIDQNTEGYVVASFNPFRYKGYYYDFEINMYYVGNGIFLDSSGHYVMNDFTYDQQACMDAFSSYWSSMNGYSEMNSRAVPPDVQTLINNVATYSTYLLSLSATSEAVSNVTQPQWNSGLRWYSGRNQTEIVSRCIYAENTASNRSNDRKGVMYVIANRVNADPAWSTAYAAVTAAGQFSTVNPGSFNASNTETAIARAAKDPTDQVWKESVTMGCLLYYTQDYSMMQYVYTKPAGISNQDAFRGFTSSASISISGGYYYIGGYQATNVAIAGVGTFSADSYSYVALLFYRDNNYNVFFKYV